MRLIYAISKVVSVIVVTLGVYSVFITGYGFLRLFKLPVDSWRNKCLKTWGRLAAKSLSIDINVIGTKPEPPFFLVCNHLSYVDIIVLFSCLDTTFVAKSEVADWPVIGFIARSIGVVFIDRKRRSDVARVNEEISNSVTKNRGLTLFPEGTTSPGSKILRFRAGLLDYPARSDFGAHYCALSYSTNSKNGKDRAYEIVSWWGDSELHSHVTRLAKERSIKATIVFGDSVIRGDDRKILAQKLHRKVSEIFIPMCQPDSIEFEPLKF